METYTTDEVGRIASGAFLAGILVTLAGVFIFNWINGLYEKIADLETKKENQQ